MRGQCRAKQGTRTIKIKRKGLPPDQSQIETHESVVLALNLAVISLNAAENRLKTGEDYYIDGKLMSSASYASSLEDAAKFLELAQGGLRILRNDVRGSL